MMAFLLDLANIAGGLLLAAALLRRLPRAGAALPRSVARTTVRSRGHRSARRFPPIKEKLT